MMTGVKAKVARLLLDPSLLRPYIDTLKILQPLLQPLLYGGREQSEIGPTALAIKKKIQNYTTNEVLSVTCFFKFRKDINSTLK